MRALIGSDRRLGLSWLILLAALILAPLTASAQQSYLLGELQGGASITGTVFDAATGQPIAVVWIVGESYSASQYTSVAREFQ